jgi:hypothetical protein
MGADRAAYVQAGQGPVPLSNTALKNACAKYYKLEVKFISCLKVVGVGGFISQDKPLEIRPAFTCSLNLV